MFAQCIHMGNLGVLHYNLFVTSHCGLKPAAPMHWFMAMEVKNYLSSYSF